MNDYTIEPRDMINELTDIARSITGATNQQQRERDDYTHAYVDLAIDRLCGVIATGDPANITSAQSCICQALQHARDYQVVRRLVAAHSNLDHVLVLV